MGTKPERCEKIIQFGEGGFLRGFADWIIQLTDEATDFNASVVVVQPIELSLIHISERRIERKMGLQGLEPGTVRL